jgi:hypothetical protein
MISVIDEAETKPVMAVLIPTGKAYPLTRFSAGNHVVQKELTFELL